MTNNADTRIEEFNSILEDCANFCSIARDSELQKDACTRLQALIVDCEASKSTAIASGAEDFANLLLGFECVARCLYSEIKMWLLLKAEEPDAAWDELVAAQTAAADAARAHERFTHLEQHAERLAQIEKLVFPPQVFVSAGMIVRHQECSICGKEYGDCEHVAGRPYWGRFCCIVAKDIEGDHVAVVDNPADKRCRVVTFSAQGGERNRMTWKTEPKRMQGDSDVTAVPNIDSDSPVRATIRLLSLS